LDHGSWRGRQIVSADWIKETLISAVRAGELDDLFNQAAKTGSIGKARKAA